MNKERLHFFTERHCQLLILVFSTPIAYRWSQSGAISPAMAVSVGFNIASLFYLELLRLHHDLFHSATAWRDELLAVYHKRLKEEIERQ
jgi:hypothetical protein